MVELVLLIASVLACCREVFASPTVLTHYMVANTASFSQADWSTDMTNAQKLGIDGFALNWGPPWCSLSSTTAYVPTQIGYAFAAAKALGNFKLIFSFDMSYTPEGCSGGSAWNITYMADMIDNYAASGTFLLWDNNIVVSTYGGDDPDYGNVFFTNLKAQLEQGNLPIVLVPALTTYSTDMSTLGSNPSPSSQAAAVFSDNPSIDGFFNWQTWPDDNGVNVSAQWDVDFKTAQSNAGRTGPYIMAVSPWQFKDLSEQNLAAGNDDNSWVEYSDVLYANRWQQAISTVHPDIVEIVTWNDWAESHYIGYLPPSSGTGDRSVQLYDEGNYVYNHDHSPWQVMTQYYATWFKSGTQALTSGSCQVVYWYRLHPKAATCTQGWTTVRNSNQPADAVFAWAIASTPSTVSMTVGANANWQFNVGTTGPVMNMVAFPSNLGSGVNPSVSIIQNGNTVASGTGSCTITSGCTWADFNPCVMYLGY